MGGYPDLYNHLFAMSSASSSPGRLAPICRLLLGAVAVLLLVPVTVEVIVRGFTAWKFIMAATGLALLLLFAAVTGRRIWQRRT